MFCRSNFSHAKISMRSKMKKKVFTLFLGGHFQGRVDGATIEFIVRARRFAKEGYEPSIHYFCSKSDINTNRLRKSGYKVLRLRENVYVTQELGIPIFLRVSELDFEKAINAFAYDRNSNGTIKEVIKIVGDFLDEERPNLVTEPFGQVLSLATAQLKGIPTHVQFVTVPDSRFPWLKSRNVQRTYAASLRTTVSKAAGARLKKDYGFSSAVLPPASILNADRKPRLKSKGHILQVNTDPLKGGMLTWTLAKLLPEYSFAVVKNWEVNNWPEEKSVFELRPLSNVKILPRTNQMKSYYRKSAILLVPSLHNEGFGLVAFEGLLMGIPVIASRLGGLPEALGGGGFLVSIPLPEPTPSEFYFKPQYYEAAIRRFISIIRKLNESPSFYRRSVNRTRLGRARVLQKFETAHTRFFKSLGALIE